MGLARAPSARWVASLGLASAALLWRPLPAVALNVGGAICNNTTWHLADSPIVVTSGLIVGGTTFCAANPKPTLTIEAGVEVRFASSKVLDIFGTLIARGTAEAPIHFTSNKGPPSPGDWLGIRFEDASTDATFDGSGNYIGGSILEHCLVEYATDTGGSGVVGATSAAPFLKDVTVKNCNPTYVVYVYDTGPQVIRMQNVWVQSNTCSYGLYVYSSGLVDLAGIKVANNTLNGTGLTVYSNDSSSRATQLEITDNTGGGSYGLSVSSGSGMLISNAVVSGNAGAGIYGSGFTLQDSMIAANGGIGVSATAATLSRLMVYNNGGAGVAVSNSPSGVSISGSCISSNQGAGLDLSYYSSATVRQTTIVNYGGDGTVVESNVYYAVDIQQSNLIQTVPVGASGPYAVRDNLASGSNPVVATNNWWGTSDADAVEDLIFHCLDQATLGCVQSSPLAAGPIAGAPDIGACANGTFATGTTTTTTTTTSTTKLTTSSTTTTRPPTTSTSTTSSTTTTLTITTSTTPTTATSTTTPAVTTSTTSSTVASSTVTSSSSTSSTTASSLPITTSTTATSTTSTTVPHCGNGVLEPELGEQCDPGPPDSADRYCCYVPSCRPYNVGGACGPVRQLGGCETGDRCDAQGHCRVTLKPGADECRPAGTNSNCDLGDSCDGLSPECPATGDIPCASVRPEEGGGTTVDVLCQAPKGVFSLRPKCTTVGLQATGSSPAARTSARPEVDAGSCTGKKQVSVRVTRPLQDLGDPSFLQRQIKLKLNAFGRSLLQRKGSLDVCVLVKVTAGRLVVGFRRQTVTVRR